jgi:hypothetical protein
MHGICEVLGKIFTIAALKIVFLGLENVLFSNLKTKLDNLHIT